MENRKIYSKKLCMTELETEHTVLDCGNYFESVEGRESASFVYIVHGEMILNAVGQKVSAEAGSLLYIPEGVRYNAIWQGNPEIEYYAFHIISKSYDITNTVRYEIQRIAPLSQPHTKDIFSTIFELFATGERHAKVRAIGMYYLFYADVLSYLTAVSPIQYHPALLTAISFIEEHYAEEFDVIELAAKACISESRLYHLFRDELDTTPIKFRNLIRVERAAQALRTGNASIDEIASSNGFHSTIYFRETFKSATGMTPTDYRTMARAVSYDKPQNHK